jgi:cytidyltransferase-like protein
MIFRSVEHWAEDWGYLKRSLVCTSGGFDPLHCGHVRGIREAAGLAKFLLVIVNGDGFLNRKKGFAFMPHQERMEIVNAIRGVRFVVPWDDGTQTVCGALEIIRPKIFAKGGDRIAGNVPEEETCKRIGCKIVYGVGGGKIQSSQALTEKVAQQYADKQRQLPDSRT